VRRAVAAVAILIFLAAYIAGAVTLAERLPNVVWMRLAYFLAAGFVWVLPVMPILAWTERGGDRKRR
jgi:hypothetical protein